MMELEVDENFIRHDPSTCTGMAVDACNSLALLLGRENVAPLNPQPVIPVTVNWTSKSQTKVDEQTSPNDEAEQILKEILNPSKVKTVLQFNKACKVFLATKTKPTGLSSKTESATLILASVVDRCTDKKQKRFWPKTSLLRIIEECNVAASSCSSFLLLAIEMKDIDVIKCCIDHMQDIPDSMLTRCLQFYIRHFQGKSISEDETEDETPSPSVPCPLTSTYAQCVNKVLCCPFNDTFIIDTLRQCSFDEAMVLLRYLHFLLLKTSAAVQDDCIPTLNIVADWISALLDAHFTQLLLSHEARSLLTELAQSVQAQELFYTELEAVKTLLQSFKESVSVPVKQTTGSYNIEVLIM